MQSGSSKNLVQALLTLFDQLLGWCDDLFGQELEQLVLIGEADWLQYTLLYLFCGRLASIHRFNSRASLRRCQHQND